MTLTPIVALPSEQAKLRSKDTVAELCDKCVTKIAVAPSSRPSDTGARLLNMACATREKGSVR